MRYWSPVLAVVALASMGAVSAEAQSVYVAPGGVYIAGGPVYVTPAPTNGVAPYVAPSTYGYGPPVVAAPPPVVAPTAYYGTGASYYGYSGAPVVAYGAEIVPRPPLPIPYYRRARCYGPCY
jgi:hypothetical protein